VIFIDSTYGILPETSSQRKDNTCLAIIAGVTQYGKTSILAAALMTKEDKSNYTFLLKTYESVGFIRPQTVLTDQHVGLISAIKEIWGSTVSHHYCLFHVYRDIQQRLGNLIN